MVHVPGAGLRSSPAAALTALTDKAGAHAPHVPHPHLPHGAKTSPAKALTRRTEATVALIGKPAASRGPDSSGSDEALSFPRASKDDIIHWIVNSTPEGRHRVMETVVRRYSAQVTEGKGDGKPVVGFGAGTFFATEGDSYARVDLNRIGPSTGVSRVLHRTLEGSAIAGEHFTTTFGELVFERGDGVRDFRVPIADSNLWNATLEFTTEFRTSGGVNCHVDPYSAWAEVKLLDNDVFPSNKYRERVIRQGPHAIYDMELMWEYIKLNLRANPKVKTDSIKMLLLYTLGNINFLASLFLEVWLVDYVLNTSVPIEDLGLATSRRDGLTVYALATLIPFAIMHFLHWRASWFKTCSDSEHFLERSLLRKFLNYNDKSRGVAARGDLVMLFFRDIVHVVEKGFMAALKLGKQLGSLFVIVAFQLASPETFDAPWSVVSLICSVAIPALMVVIVVIRWAKISRALEELNQSQNRGADRAAEAAANDKLIRDLDGRARFLDHLTETLVDHSAARRTAGQLICNTKYFLRYVTVIATSSYLLYGGRQVIRGILQTGLFLTNLTVLYEVGDAWNEVFMHILEMKIASPALKQIAYFANLRTEVPDRSRLSKVTRASTMQRRAAVLARRVKENERKSSTSVVDVLPIEVKNLQLDGYMDMDESLSVGSLSLRQGQIAALVGPPAAGKRILLQVIAGVILPRASSAYPGLYVPRHLRVQHVTLEPMFIKGSLFENLVMGVIPGTGDGDRARVRRICEKLGLDETNLKLLDRDDEHAWHSVLSQSQAHILCIARALVANPDILCIHKPTQPFDKHTASETVMKVLKEFVKRRGVEKDRESAHMRRPRTLIFTASEMSNVGFADRIFMVSRENGIRETNKVEGRIDAR